MSKTIGVRKGDKVLVLGGAPPAPEPIRIAGSQGDRLVLGPGPCEPPGAGSETTILDVMAHGYHYRVPTLTASGRLNGRAAGGLMLVGAHAEA